MSGFASENGLCGPNTQDIMGQLWGHPAWKENNTAIVEKRLEMINAEDLNRSAMESQYQECKFKLKFKNQIDVKTSDVLKSEIIITRKI